MSGQLLAALGGAIVAFCGTGFLQASRNRRADRDGARERLGITRGLKAALHGAEERFEIAHEFPVLITRLRFPLAVWEAEGHRLLATLAPDEARELVEAFGKLGASNALMEAAVDSSKDQNQKDLRILQDRVQKAMPVLDREEARYAKLERELSLPLWRALLNRLRNGAREDSAIP